MKTTAFYSLKAPKDYSWGVYGVAIYEASGEEINRLRKYLQRVLLRQYKPEQILVSIEHGDAYYFCAVGQEFIATDLACVARDLNCALRQFFGLGRPSSLPSLVEACPSEVRRQLYHGGGSRRAH
ncbi:MAG: hypothetical protein AAB545_02880 [Patescibacteria group bacterium]